MQTYPIHPFCDAYPPMPEEALRELGEDIKAHGLLEDIWLYEGQILDGRNRYLAARMVGYTIPKERYRVFDEETMGHPIDFVISRNHHRRHMSTRDRLAVSTRLKDRLTTGKPLTHDSRVTVGSDRHNRTTSAVAARGAGI